MQKSTLGSDGLLQFEHTHAIHSKKQKAFSIQTPLFVLKGRSMDQKKFVKMLPSDFT